MHYLDAVWWYNPFIWGLGKGIEYDLEKEGKGYLGLSDITRL